MNAIQHSVLWGSVSLIDLIMDVFRDDDGFETFTDSSAGGRWAVCQTHHSVSTFIAFSL